MSLSHISQKSKYLFVLLYNNSNPLIQFSDKHMLLTVDLYD